MSLVVEVATFEDAGEGEYTLSVIAGEPAVVSSSVPGSSAHTAGRPSDHGLTQPEASSAGRIRFSGDASQT